MLLAVNLFCRFGFQKNGTSLLPPFAYATGDVPDIAQHNKDRFEIQKV